MSLSLLSCSLWFFSPLVFQSQIIFERDVSSVWHAQVEAIVRAVGEGVLPLWDPHASFGEPLMEFAAQILYPPTLFALIMPPGVFYSSSVLAHHVFGGAGLYLFLRAQGLSRVSSVFGATLWMSSGSLLSVVNMLNLFCGSAWMPWILLAADHARRSRRPGAAVLWGASVALCMLTGSETVLMAGAASGVWFLAGSSSLRDTCRLTPLAGVAFLTAVLLAAAQWIPLLALLPQTSRANLSHWVRTFWSLHPLALLQLPFPAFVEDIALSTAKDLADLTSPLFYSVFIGAPALALAAAGAFGRVRRGGLFFSAVAALGIAFALGRHAPIYDPAVALLAPLRAIRYPVKACLLVSLSLSVLAAFGLDAVRSGERGRRVTASVLVGLCLGVLTAGFFGKPLLESVLQPGASPEAAMGLLGLRLGAGLAASSVFLAAQTRIVWCRIGRAAPVALALLALVQPAVFHYSLNAVAPEAVLRYRPPVIDEIRKEGGSRVFSRTRLTDTSGIAPIPAFPTGVDPRLATVLNYKQMLLPDIARVFALSSSYEQDLRGVQSIHLARLSGPVLASEDGPWVLKLLQVGAVTHAITLNPKVPQGLDLVWSQKTLLGNTVYLYRVQSPLPRCYVVGGVASVDGDQALTLLTWPGFDPRRTVILPDVPSRPPPDGDAGSCRVIRFATSRVEVDVTAQSDVFVVLVDAYSPSWRATVDGDPALVHRANIAFRAVAVPAGRHSVIWSYSPPMIWIGLAVSVAGLLLAASTLAADRAGWFDGRTRRD